MKKNISLLICILMLFPIMVKALVNADTEVTDRYTSFDECKNEVNTQNGNAFNQATEGYYLYCIKVTCENNVYKHETQTQPTITCANGNPNPQIISAGGVSESYKKNTNCTDSTQVIIGSEKIQYKCSKTTSGTDYVVTTTKKNNNQSSTTSNVDTNLNTNNNSQTSENQQVDTGVEDYYLVLGSAMIVLTAGVMILNKKNAFKNI